MAETGPATREAVGKGGKGGRIAKKAYTAANGYRYIKDDEGRWIAYHRYVMEQHLGRKLTQGERVYFKDDDKTNFALDNLVLKEVKASTKQRYGRIEELYELIDDLTIRIQNLEQIHEQEIQELLADD